MPTWLQDTPATTQPPIQPPIQQPIPIFSPVSKAVLSENEAGPATGVGVVTPPGKVTPPTAAASTTAQAAPWLSSVIHGAKVPRLFAGKSNEDIEEDVRNILLKGEEEELPAMTSLIWILTIPATVLLLSVLILIIRRRRRSAATRLVETTSVAMSMTNLNRQEWKREETYITCISETPSAWNNCRFTRENPKYPWDYNTLTLIILKSHVYMYYIAWHVFFAALYNHFAS